MFQWHITVAFRDVSRNKGRFILAIAAIALSITMLVGVNGTVDNYANSFTEFVFERLSDTDIIVNHANNELITNASALLPSFQGANLKGVSFRYQADAGLFYTQKGEQKSLPVKIVGLNISQENYLGLGEFIPEVTSIGINECLLIGSFGEQISNVLGQNLDLRLFLPTNDAFNISLSVAKEVEQHKRLPMSLWNVIVVDIETIYQITDRDSATSIVGVFSDHEKLYSITDISNSINTAKSRGSIIQRNLGLDYAVNLPLAQVLERAEESLMNQRIMVNFIGIIILIISAILIFSLMTTSIEEKTHEYAIYRAVGSKDETTIIQGLLQAVIIGFFGVILGVIFAYFLTSILGNLVEFSIQPNIGTYLYAVVISFIVTILAALYPVLNATKKQILVALDVSRSESTNFETRVSTFRTGWINWSSIFYGILLSFLGLFVFVIMPGTQHIYGQDVMQTLALIILVFTLIGLILIIFGFLSPLLERTFLSITSFISHQATFAANLFIRKNRRRNNLTTMIFALTLAFVFFMNTLMTVNAQDQIYYLQAWTGSDFLIHSMGMEQAKYIDEKVLNYTKEYSGITSSMLTSEGIFSITGCSVQFGDDLFFKSYSPTLYGTHGNLLDALFPDSYLVPGSEFNKIDNNQTIVIAGSLAKALDLTIGDSIRVQVSSSIQTSEEKYRKDIYLEVVAIVTRLPGLTSFSDNEDDAPSSSVLIGPMTWQTLVSPTDDSNATILPKMEDFIQRIFVRNEEADLDAFEIALFTEFGTSIRTIIYEREYDRIQQNLEMSVMLLTVLLSLSVIIAFFAVFSSTSTTVIESKRDIGILKAIGLKDRDIANIFVVESVVLCLSSSILGALAGYITAYLPSINNALWNNRPIPIVAPPSIIIFTFIFAIVLAIIGAYIPSRGISRLNTTEILR